MFKIEKQPTAASEEKKYRILCYTFNFHTNQMKEVYSISNISLPEVVNFIRGRNESYLEFDVLEIFNNTKRNHCLISDQGEILPQ